jgi:hypothetical protein
VVEELLDAFGMKLGIRYNVGCHFGATVASSELGNEAWEKQLKCLVGSFHGHAHNRLCQLRFLATYVEGMGLEDLEGCEHFFSRSNGLAKSCCYASGIPISHGPVLQDFVSVQGNQVPEYRDLSGHHLD